MIKQIIALVVFLVVSFSAAGIGTLATTPNIATWYAGLAKPTWNPPNWVFGPVWTFLYISMAVAAWLVWRRRRDTCGWPGFHPQMRLGDFLGLASVRSFEMEKCQFNAILARLQDAHISTGHRAP